MLGKLLKHEYKYYAKRFIPIVIVELCAALIVRIMATAAGGTPSEINAADSDLITVFMGIFSLTAGIASIVLICYSFFAGISRFRSNLYTDEGYLTNTLPVKSHEILFSKLIGALSCYVGAYIFNCISEFILGISSEDDFSFFMFNLFEYASADYFDTADMIIMYLKSLVTYMVFLLFCYLIEAVINKMNSKRGMAMFLGITLFFINTFVISVIRVIVSESDEITSYAAYQLFIIIYYLVLSALMFLITNNLIKNHLNLE